MMKQSVSGLDSDATTQGDMASEIRLRELALEEKRIEGAQEQKRIDAEQEQRSELRNMELELKMIEKKRLEREAEAEQKRLERDAEYRREQMKLELEMKWLELEGASEKVKVLGMMRKPWDLAKGGMPSTVVRNTLGIRSVMFCRLCRLRFRNFLNFSIRSKSLPGAGRSQS